MGSARTEKREGVGRGRVERAAQNLQVYPAIPRVHRLLPPRPPTILLWKTKDTCACVRKSMCGAFLWFAVEAKKTLRN